MPTRARSQGEQRGKVTGAWMPGQPRVQGRSKVKVLVTQLCLTLCKPMDYSSPVSSVHGILQARILELVAMSFSRGSSQLGD